MIKDIRPPSIVEGEGFREFVHELDPRYILPSRKTLTEKALPEEYDHVMKNVEEALKGTDHVALTTDMWTSTNTDAFNTITAHFTNEEGQHQTKILNCSKFENRHYAAELKKELFRVMELFNIKDKIVAIVTDNAGNIVAAIGLMEGIIRIPCAAHCLNLVVTASLKSAEEITDLRNKMADIVSYTHRSPHAKILFLECQTLVGIEGKFSEYLHSVEIWQLSCHPHFT